MKISLPISIIAILFLIATASADVHISNKYYSEGTTVNNNVFLHDVDYINSVRIMPGNILTMAGEGSNSTGCNDGSFYDNSRTDSCFGNILSNLAISAQKLSYAKSISGSPGYPEVSYGYALGTGIETAGFSNKVMMAQESLLSYHNNYSANYDVKPDSATLTGYGSRFSFEDKNSSFLYNINVAHGGKWADTQAYLIATKKKESNVTPVIYDWNVSVNGDESHAKSHFDMAFIAGDRTVDAMIRGLDSNGLEPTVPVNGVPWHVDPIPDGSAPVGQTLHDLIILLHQGISNSGYIDWTL